MNRINKITSQFSSFFEVFKALIVLIVASALYSCTDNTWDKHYQADPAIVSGDNLWTTLEAQPELSIFTGWLKAYGYDKTLSQSQAYTIFAPKNSALADIDTTGLEVKTEWIENHIARFIIPASGVTPYIVGTLNRKRIDLTNIGGTYFFGAASFTLPNQSIVASNGLIHVLDNYEPFFPNIWEYLTKQNDLDSIKNYFYSFDEIVFDESSSVPGSVVNGQQTYLDSVFINKNSLLQNLRGYINREDSSYVMLVPNNTAWIEAYDRIKDDFVYYNLSARTADSLQRTNAGYALVQDLIFSNTVQSSPKDSLTSTSRNTFYNPQELFAGTEEVITSNGKMYITNQLKIKPYESWHKSIKVEAERAFGRENTLSTVSTPRAEGVIAVSGGRYLLVTPSTASGNPTITFEIPNTLSSTYNIYCVFVPVTVNNPNAKSLSCKVYFNLAYLNRSGNYMTDRFPASGTIDTNPYTMDTVLIASDFKFPTANYNEEITTVTLKVVSNVGRNETANFSRELLLDCILFEPQKQ
ncbi:MAG: hypothetical protein EZS26_000935 [Candidatus Ordinivivax streblomastigis]|uniref:FAS1 domain-containing protein n=1 Tax=Candidatus Ordinivivax streblomastigis TaxID=2540710 RepID=A0A5M8P2R9_9BACT|nr:MAG: hypothetical protein EZS26_000935 [Candidatus Ordinivivax streblomastigis]